MYGNSEYSAKSRSYSERDYTYAFQMSAENTYYSASIDWNDEDLNWKSALTYSLRSLASNPTNTAILKFISNWGTHVLNEMQTGSFCRQTAFVASSATKESVQSFQNSVSSGGLDFIFWHIGGTQRHLESRTGTWSHDVKYEFNNIGCSGEIDITSQDCLATATSNNPVAISYALLPIWKTKYFKKVAADITVTAMQDFFDDIFASLYECGKTNCNNNNGTCTLRSDIWTDSFIDNWEDGDFESLWDIDASCFCNEGFYGPHCTETVWCKCYGDEGCCCHHGGKCNSPNLECWDNGMCDVPTDENKGEIYCLAWCIITCIMILFH